MAIVPPLVVCGDVPTPLLTFAPAVTQTAPFNAEALRAALGDGKLMAVLAASQVFAVLSYWIASKLMTRERATLGRAVLIYVAYFALIYLVVCGLAVGLPYFMHIRSPERALLFAGGMVLLFFSLLVALPMRLYAIGFFHAIGFILVAFVISVLASGGLQLAVLGRSIFDPAPVQQWVSQQMPKPPLPREVRLEQLRSREDDLARRYQQLSIRQRHLPSGDQKAEEAYRAALADYERDAQQFRSDAAAIEAELQDDGAAR